MSATSKQWADLGERVAWTLLQAGIGVEAVNLLDVSPAWAAAIAGGLAVIKGMLAVQFGNGTAATLPVSVERS